MLILSVTFIPALADVILPSNLTVIEEEVFRGDKSLDMVIIPDNVTTIRSGAFAETAMQSITIPSSVTSISSDAFDDVSGPMLVLTSPDAFAVNYALSNNLDFRADTEFRALLIGQSDYGNGLGLEGPKKDIVKMQNMLTEYDVTVMTNLTSAEILDAIPAVFSGASKEDISLFYYTGHGDKSDGSLIGIDFAGMVTAAELRSALDAVPGRKIVIIDACASGALIGRSASDPASVFISAFTAKRFLLFSNLAAQQYFVMAASKGDEESYEASNGGIFTDAFVNSKNNGDENSDHIISFEESYHYTKETVNNFVSRYGKTQSVQVYPENCYWFGLFR